MSAVSAVSHVDAVTSAPSKLKLLSRASATAMSFGSGSALSRCSPPRLPALAPASVVLAGVELADEVAVSELWLEDGVLVASFWPTRTAPTFEVRVAAAGGDGVDDLVTAVSCGRCGDLSLCEHGVAALLCAHGQAGASARLVSKAGAPAHAGGGFGV